MILLFVKPEIGFVTDRLMDREIWWSVYRSPLGLKNFAYYFFLFEPFKSTMSLKFSDLCQLHQGRADKSADVASRPLLYQDVSRAK